MSIGELALCQFMPTPISLVDKGDSMCYDVCVRVELDGSPEYQPPDREVLERQH